MPRPTPAPPASLEITQVLHALADPVRLSIVRQLRESDAPIACGDFDVEVAKSTLSHHFRVLRESGVTVAWHADGRTVLNRLREDELDQRFPGLLAAVLE